MKNALFYGLFTLLSLFAGPQAFALECGGMNLKFVGNNGQLYCSKEEAAANDRNRANLFSSNNNTIVMPAQRQPVYVIPIPIDRSQQPELIQHPVHSQQPVRFVAVHDSPGHFVSGGNMYNCSTLRNVVGGTIGAFIGYHVGKEIKIDQGTLSGGGAIGGAFIGSQIACEMIQTGTPSRTIVQEGQTTASTGRICQAGTTWKSLDWPGHPQHGKEACLPPDEIIAAQKAHTQGQIATSTGPICATGTTWRTLDWPGHPKHNKEACLPPDEKIQQQKALHEKTS